MSHQFFDWCEQVKASARGQWPEILQALGGLDARQVNSSRAARNKGSSCPVCGTGVDRYSFKDVDTGGWGCRKCGGGDGIGMLMRINCWPFKKAMQEIAEYLGVDPYNGQCIDPYLHRIAQERAQQRKEESLRKRKQEDQERAKKLDQKAAYALALYNRSQFARPGHPYLHCHGELPPFNLHETQHRQYGWCLLVPLHNEHGELRDLQYIMAVAEVDAKGKRNDKRMISGEREPGLFYRFVNPAEDPTYTIYICEGWATGAAIYLDMPNHPSVLCAMSTGNLMAVVEIARRKFPDNRLVIAADHDEAGIKAAYEAAERFGLEVALPPKGQDFCDVHINRKKEKQG